MLRLALLAAAVAVGLVSTAVAAQFKVMIVTWRGCEDACRGFQEYLIEQGVEAEFLLRDAARNKDALSGFVEEARAEDVDLILTWGTSVTRGIVGTLSDAGDPLFDHGISSVFTIVADPVGAGIVSSLDSTGRLGVTGTFNRVPERVNIETIRSYNPQFKQLGLLYNSDEENSVLKRDEIAGLAGPMGFELVALELSLGKDGKPRVEDIAPKMAELKSAGVDFLYLGSSSFLRDNGDLVTGLAVDNGIPVLSPYEKLVHESQALMSVASRYYDVGRLAGQQAKRILVDGVAAGELPVLQMTDFAIVINMEVARELGLYPPIGLLQVAETVN